MAKKNKTIYVCESCGNEFLNWEGQCPACKNWNTLKEMKQIETSGNKDMERKKPQPLSKIEKKEKDRFSSKIMEYDRVLGGGIVPGSIVLLAGEPGIGKSTLLLQVAQKVNKKVLYVTGEESKAQLRNRSERVLDEDSENGLDILASQNIDDIRSVASQYQLIIVDSIQTIVDPSVNSQPGGVAQVKRAAQALQTIAKTKEIAVIISGQITKEGRVAGPKTLEHLVDTVLYLEGEEFRDQRIVRAIKNRFGSTGEAGIFQMTRNGMEEVKNPSDIFLKNRSGEPGSVVSIIMEGQRPLMIEVQALTERTVFGYPTRRGEGVKKNRIELLSAVLSKRTQIDLSDKDIYVNIIGGMSVEEPSIDLGICLAIISSVLDQPINKKWACLGEVGLSGEIRMVSDLEKRIREAKKMGFEKILIPKIKEKKFTSKKIGIIELGTLKEALKTFKTN